MDRDRCASELLDARDTFPGPLNVSLDYTVEEARVGWLSTIREAWVGRVDDEEFSDFVLGASPRLLRTAWLLCGDPVHAEELVQASLERVYLKWRRVREGEPLAYTRRIVLNLHVDHVRRTRREHLTDAMPEMPAPAVAGPEEGDYLMHLLRQLPLRERQVVVLRHYVGESEAQAATTLGVSVGTVKSSASRGLARLRALHAQEGSHVR